MRTRQHSTRISPSKGIARQRAKKKSEPPPRATFEFGTFHGRDVIVQYGLRGAPDEFRWRIKAFLNYYLGTERKPNAFGGRGAFIEELNAWLQDRDAPRNLLLWGPAGRGKSALIVQWLLQLDETKRRVFVPISIRADTSAPGVFFEALATRLATILDRRLEQPSSNPVAFYKERALEYLSAFDDPENPCLLVIDGLDEANGWSINPLLAPDPPAGLKVLVSARLLAQDVRDKGWLRRLGWDAPAADVGSREVPRLDREGVRDVLERMGDPLGRLADEAEINDELYRLTDGGDPLLLSLYIRELVGEAGKAGSLKAADLCGMQPGLEGLFSTWYDNQKKLWGTSGEAVDLTLVETMLAVLACALGPLVLSDIEEITRRALPPPERAITPGHLDPLKRWCITTASPAGTAAAGLTQGLVLSHPRLGQFFRETAFATSGLISRVCEAIRSWGRDAARGANGSAGPVPRYVLQHHLQHLEQEPAPPLECYRELAEDRWRLAWKAEEGGYGTFSDQMALCWRKLDEAHRADPEVKRRPGVGLGGLIHIGLCLSSIRSIGTDVPPSIVLEMVAQGLLTVRDALLIARFRSDDSARAAILMGLVEAAPDDAGLHARIAAEAGAIADRLRQAEVMVAVARRGTMPLAETLEKAVDLAARYKSSAAYSSAWEDNRVSDLIAQMLALAGDDPVLLPRLESAVAAHVPEPRRPDATTRELAARAQQARLLTLAAPSDTVAVQVAAEAPTPPPARKEADPDFDPLAWAGTLSRGEMDDISFNAFQHLIEQNEGQDAASADVLAAMLDVALKARPHVRRKLLAALAPNLPPDLIARAVAATLDGDDPWRDDILADLALYLDEEEQAALVWRLLPFETIGSTDREAAARNFSDSEAAANVLSVVAADVLEWVMPAVGRRMADASGPSLFRRIAHRLGPEHLAGVVAEALAAEPSIFAAETVAVVRERLSDAQKQQVVDHALASPADATSWRRREMVREIVPALGPGMLDALLTRLAAMPDRAERLSWLDEILPQLPAERRREAVGTLQNVALTIGDQPMAALALGALGLQPPLADAPAGPWRALMDGKNGMTGALSLAFLALLPHVEREVAERALLQARDQAAGLEDEDRPFVALLSTMSPHLGRMTGESLVRDLLDRTKEKPEERGPGASLLLFSRYVSGPQAQDVTGMLLHGMRNAAGDEQALYGAILLLSPHTGMSDAAAALACIRHAIDQPDTELAKRSILLAALALCSRLSRGELAAIQRGAAAIAPGAPPSVAEDDIVDRIARFCLLGLLEGDERAALYQGFVAELARLSRREALMLIAAAEGGWDRVMGLHPAISGGANSESPLRRLGGDGAAAEVVASIRQVTAWWP